MSKTSSQTSRHLNSVGRLEDEGANSNTRLEYIQHDQPCGYRASDNWASALAFYATIAGTCTKASCLLGSQSSGAVDDALSGRMAPSIMCCAVA